MPSRRARVRDDDVAFGQATKSHDLLVQDVGPDRPSVLEQDQLPRCVGLAHRLHLPGEGLVRSLHQGGLAAELPFPQFLVGLELHLGRTDQLPSPLPGAGSHELPELAGHGVFHLLEPGAVIGRQEEHVVVGNPDRAHADGLVRVHLAEQALGQLDRLEAGAEGLREKAFDQPFQATLEVSE